VVLEAWAYGAKVVATRTQGPSELITDQRDGLLVEIGDVDAMSEAMYTLLGPHGGPAQSLADAGRERVETTFSESAITTRYQELYDRLTLG
jgi:glycosyltransferase involved in cell wall biosynthesis